MLTLLSKCIDQMNLYNSAAHFAEKAGEEAGAAWKDILNLLYELLGWWSWNLHVCSLLPFSSFPLCHNQSHLNLFVFIHSMHCN